MSVGYNIAEFAATKAMKRYLEERLETKLPVYRGDDFTKNVKALCVFVQPDECVEPDELSGTATMEVSLLVGVKSIASVPVEEHEEACAKVMDLVFNDAIPSALNGLVNDLVVQQIKRGTRTTTIDADNAERNTAQRIRLLCSMDGSSATL